MSPAEAKRLVGHSPAQPEARVSERLDDIIRWVDGNRACIWVERDVADLRDALAEIERLRTALRAVRVTTCPKWAARLISEALREVPA
jgi:hypothetical protein